MDDEMTEVAVQNMNIIEAIEQLRQIDSVELSFCYAPHGEAVFVSMGEPPDKKIVGSDCSIPLYKAIKKALAEAINKIEAR
jgi:hypothetical protein